MKKKSNSSTILSVALLIAAIVLLVVTGHLNILLAIFMIGVVICFHEFGHFLIARLNGVTVKEFSLGLGPRLLSWKMLGTRWSLKLLPFGGSCLMLDDGELAAFEEEETEEDPEEESPKEEDGSSPEGEENADAGTSADEETIGKTKKAGLKEDPENGSFASKNVWQRISIIFAGPFFNFLLAFLLACIILGSIGYDPSEVRAVSDEVADQTGLEAGDIITSYQGHSIMTGRDLALYESLDGVPRTISITYERDGKSYSKTYDALFIQKYLCGISYTEYREGTIVPMTLEGVTGAAEEAGLKKGDIVVRFNGVEINTATDFRNYVEEHPIGADPVEFVISRDGAEQTVRLTPKLTEEYQFGFDYNTNSRKKVGALGVIRYGVHEVGYWIKATVKSLGYMLRGKASRKDVGGAVRVVSEMSDVVEDSYKTDGAFYAFLNLINWAILLSANLGVMNLLPIPALDGGRLLFLFVEAIRGKKVNPKVEATVTMIGFMLLMILMIFILFNDISNVFGMILPR